MPASRLVRMASALAMAASVALSGPAAVRAESALWTLTASPLAATTGVQTTFSLTATNEDPLAAVLSSSEIGCIDLEVPSNFSVNSAAVTGSNAGGGWHIDFISGNLVRVHTDSGGERLALLDWVAFTVTATPMSTGSLAWGATAYRDNQCRGTGALLGVPPIVVVSGPALTPTPTPMPTPTPAPSPTPTPTPLLPLPSQLLPPPPLPSLSAPTPSPSEPAPLPSATPVLTVPGLPGSSPSTSPSPGSPDGSNASSAPSADGAPGGSSGGATGTGDASPVGPGGVDEPRAAQIGSFEVGRDAALRVAFDAGELELGLGDLALDSSIVWLVPAATIAGPGLLLLLALAALQAAGAAAWVPAVRRLRGEVMQRT